VVKLLIGSKKLGVAKNGMDLLYHHAKYGGIVGRMLAVDEEV